MKVSYVSSDRFSYLLEKDLLSAKKLAQYIAKQNWVLFVGSGVSRDSGIPIWRDLTQKMIDEIGEEYRNQSYLEIVSLYEINAGGRSALVEFLRKELSGKSPNFIHQALIDLNPVYIVTTNVEDLIEKELDRRGVIKSVVIKDFDLTSTSGTLPVYKPHGDLGQQDTLVFTRTDYSQYPKHKIVNDKLITLAAEHSFMFIGYSLNDPDLDHQFQKVIDAQGGLAREHFCIVDSISILKRKELREKRKINVIAIGTYENIIKFLKELKEEAEEISKANSHLSSSGITGSPEQLDKTKDDQLIINLFEEIYNPVVETLNKLHIKEAEEHLVKVLVKIKEVRSNKTYKDLDSLRDFHQRALLAYGTALFYKRERKKSEEKFKEAQSIRPFEGKRAIQAATLLMNLSQFDAAESLIKQASDVQEEERKKILGMLALIRDDIDSFNSLYPDGTDQGDLDFAIQFARAKVEKGSPEDAYDVPKYLGRAWELSSEFPRGKSMVTFLTEQFLRRIVIEEWDTPNIDRLKLVQTIREKYEETIQDLETLKEQLPQELVNALSGKLEFHRFLEEKEAQEEVLDQLKQLEHPTSKRVLAEYRAGVSPDVAVINKLYEDGYISLADKVVLESHSLIRNKQEEEAEKTYRETLGMPITSEEREKILESLVRLLLDRGKYSEAYSFIDQIPPSAKVFKSLMQAMFHLHKGDESTTLSILRSGLKENPRNLLILKNLVSGLKRSVKKSAISESKIELTDEDREKMQEALGYTERLTEILPCPEHYIDQAEILYKLKDYPRVLEVLMEAEKNGYGSYRLAVLKAQSLLSLEQYRDSAEYLSEKQKIYPNDYQLQFLEATGWAKAGIYTKAIPILEELRNHQQAEKTLYMNLALSYIHEGAKNPESFSKAFDICKEGLDKFTNFEEILSLFLQSAQGSGRSKEAWQTLTKYDLRTTRNLRAIPQEEAIKFLKKSTEELESRDKLYRAGLIPFSVYAEQSPRPATYLWQVRISLWKRGNENTPTICNFPRIITSRVKEIRSIILEHTALLTLGTMNIIREVLEALYKADCEMLIPENTMSWLEQEIASLSLSQMPAYKAQRKTLKEKLEKNRKIVNIVEELKKVGEFFPDDVRGKIGIFAYDLEIALKNDAYYLDDYLPEETKKVLPEDIVIRSGDLLRALEKKGIIYPEVSERLRADLPDVFNKFGFDEEVDLSKPIIFNKLTLQVWHDVGLLEDWLSGKPDWPSSIYIGPMCWSSLSQEIIESELYEEALDVAQRIGSALRDAVNAGWIKETKPITQTDLADLKIEPQLLDVFETSISTLLFGKINKIPIWSDDLFTHLIKDPRGFLVTDSDNSLNHLNSFQKNFSNVTVIGTEEILSFLEPKGYFPYERQMEVLWEMHSSGYRYLNLDEVLLWLLKRFNFNLKAQPIQKLLNEIFEGSKLKPIDIDPARYKGFYIPYLTSMVAHMIFNLWEIGREYSIPVNTKDELSLELLSKLERISTELQLPKENFRLFWESLIHHFWFGTTAHPLIPKRRVELLSDFLRWIENYFQENAEKSQYFIQAVEDFTLQIISQFDETDNKGLQVEVKYIVARLLNCILLSPFVGKFDNTFARLAGYSIGLEPVTFTETGYITFQEGDQTQEYEVTLSQEEKERKACELLGNILQGSPVQDILPDSPIHVSFSIEKEGKLIRGFGSEKKNLSVNIEIPMLFLLIYANQQLRRTILSELFLRFSRVDPDLALFIRNNFPLIDESKEVSNESLQKFYRHYLKSFHFNINRDLSRAFEYVSNLSWSGLERLCGQLPAFHKGEDSLIEIANEIIKNDEKNEALEPKHIKFSILFGASKFFTSIADAQINMFQQSSEKQKANFLLHWVHSVEQNTHIFNSLQDLATLLHLANAEPALEVDFGECKRSLHSWLNEYLTNLFKKFIERRKQLKKENLSDKPEKELEPLAELQEYRKTIHAHVLRLSYRAVASPRHIEYVSNLEEGCDKTGELMLKGLFLTYRILPIILEELRMPPEDIVARLQEIEQSLGTLWFNTSLRDQFFPELYGSGTNQYDHLVAGTLAVLQETGFKVGTSAGVQFFNRIMNNFWRPFWFTDKMKEVLIKIRELPENDSERAIKDSRENNVPNRLNTYLNKTPQEYTNMLLQE